MAQYYGTAVVSVRSALYPLQLSNTTGYWVRRRACPALPRAGTGAWLLAPAPQAVP
jgi:hypothetical protein